MSKAYEGQDPLEIAKKAEGELNSYEAKVGAQGNLGSKYGSTASDSTLESGINQRVTDKFPDSTAQYGSAASGAGDNREIPLEEGGDLNPRTGQPTKARDFEGEGGPEDKARLREEARPGDDDVQSNVRQGGETRRP